MIAVRAFVLSLAAASALHTAPCAPALRAASRRARPVASVVDDRPGEDDPEERSRLEALGRKAAEEALALDSASEGDGGLMAEFNSRIDKEGGANMFKLKTGASQIGESANEVGNKAKFAAEDLADSAGGLVSGLSEQQKNIGKIILGLIAFQLVIGLIGSAFSGGQSYSV